MAMVITEGVLFLLVVAGIVTIVWGVKRFDISARLLAIVFAITAVSWVALVIVTISLTIRALLIPSA